MDDLNDKINEFWHFVCQNLKYFQQIPVIISELNSDVPMSTATKLFLEADNKIKAIHPQLTIFINNAMLLLPREAAHMLLMQQKALLEEEGIDVPDNLMVQPTIMRFDLTITTGDPELVPLVKLIYNMLKMNKKLEVSAEWAILKFKAAVPTRHKLVFKEELNDEHLQFILHDGDLIIKVEPQLETHIKSQDDINTFRSAVLQYIDELIGDYKTFETIHNITIVPNAIYTKISKDFPEHYKLRPWSEIDSVLDTLPKGKKCSMCYVREENTRFITIVEKVDFMVGDYCEYCFKILAKLLSI